MRPNNKRAQEEKAAEEAQKAETGHAPIKEAPRIVWFKATDKRVPLIAIPIEQAPADFVDYSENYSNRLFVVILYIYIFSLKKLENWVDYYIKRKRTIFLVGGRRGETREWA